MNRGFPVRVLVVDDHQVVREGLSTMLAASHQVRVVGQAANATAALIKARELEPDVILLDIRLPGASGLDVCRTLQEVAPGSRVILYSVGGQPVSALTSAAELDKSGWGAQFLLIHGAYGGSLVLCVISSRRYSSNPYRSWASAVNPISTTPDTSSLSSPTLLKPNALTDQAVKTNNRKKT